jgi:hypothetical protein
VTAKKNDSGIDRIDRALNALMIRKNRSAAIGSIAAIKRTTLKLYSTIIAFTPMRQYYHPRVDSDVSLDVFLLHTLSSHFVKLAR